jgi:hypothetical protein
VLAELTRIQVNIEALEADNVGHGGALGKGIRAKVTSENLEGQRLSLVASVGCAARQKQGAKQVPLRPPLTRIPATLVPPKCAESRCQQSQALKRCVSLLPSRRNSQRLARAIGDM